MDTLMDQLDLDEGMESLMAQFLNGLNRDIVDQVVKKGKEKVDDSNVWNPLKCRKCQGVGHFSRDWPNRKIMTIREWEIVREDEEENEVVKEENDESESEEFSEEDPTHMSSVSRRALNTQFKEDSLDQRENLFHTRCLVQSLPCSMVIVHQCCEFYSGQDT